MRLQFWKPWFPVEQASCLLNSDGQDAHPTSGLEEVTHCVIAESQVETPG
ncbi:MAG: hypothetical protein HC878_19565 [Leptolyngbyaceae cyanobacterium SL_5_14]|nr:hypothetical protein [Leptolyngbyaceae cyanobacterium SL_5_14]